MKNSHASDSGFTLIELMIVIAVLSGIAITVGPQFVQQQVPMEQAEAAQQDIAQIKSAANAYFMENRAWPASMDELIATRYLPDDRQSPFGSPYTLANNGEHLVVSVDTGRRQLANMLVGKVPFGQLSADGERVSTSMGTPTREAIQSFFLARKPVPGCPDCNTLDIGTDIDFNGNDINNVGELDAELAVVQSATIEDATINTLDVNRINLGNNSISYNGSTINIDSGLIQVTGNMDINGQLNMNGNDITDVGTLTANEGRFINLSADHARITRIEGDVLDFNRATIDELVGDSLTFERGTITELNGTTLTYGEGNITNVFGENLTFDTGTIENLTGSRIYYKEGEIDVLTGELMDYNQIFADLVETNIATIGKITAEGLSVNQQASLDTMTATSGSIEHLVANTVDYVDAIFNTVEADKITATNANLANVKATTIDTTSLTTNDLTADRVTVNEDFTVNGLLTAENMNVTGTTTTSNLVVSADSNLGHAKATSMRVTGLVEADRIETNTLNAENGSFKTLNGTNATFSNQVTAKRFDGGLFYGRDFVVSNSVSVIENRKLIDKYVSLWKECLELEGCKHQPEVE